MRPELETTTLSVWFALDGWQNSKVMLLPLALPSGWKRTRCLPVVLLMISLPR
jgi:hypothetical protein